MTPKQIQSIRQSLGENTEQFGRRFARTGRAVEDWEQGRRNPTPVVLELLESLLSQTEPTGDTTTGDVPP